MRGLLIGSVALLVFGVGVFAWAWQRLERIDAGQVRM